MYFLNDKEKKYRVFNVDRKQEHSFVLGDGFEEFNFHFNPDVSFEEAIDKHVRWLRDNYSYIRLWFSGGKDSRIILDSAIRNNIEFDEIVTIESTVFPVVFSSRAEQVHGALPVLEKYKSRLQNTKVLHLKLDDDYFSWFYSNPEWHKLTNHWWWTIGREPDNLFEYEQKNPPLIKHSGDYLELMGFSEPSIWYDSQTNKWKFIYNNSRFNTIMPNMQTLCTGHGAGVLNAYLSELILKWESIGYFPKKFSEISGREQKENIDLFNKTKMPPGYPNTPKKTSFKNEGYPTNEKFWVATMNCWQDEAQALMMRQMLNPPNAFKLWAFETDWDAVIDQINKGGILSKEFTFEK